MRKILFFAGLAILLVITGCQKVAPPKVVPSFTFYYQMAEVQFQTPDGALGGEVREMDVDTMELEELLALYLQGPISDDYVSPFPASLSVEEFQLQNGVLSLTFSDSFSQLTGVRLSVATACITKTFLQLDTVDAILISTESGMISNQGSRMFVAEDFLYEDKSDQLFEETVILYFADVNNQYLVSETRNAWFISREDIPAYVVGELLRGPATSAARSTMPENAKLRSVYVEDGICTVDLSKEFLGRRYLNTEEALVTLYALVNSLTELEEIEGVRILVEGAPLQKFGEILVPEVMYYTKSMIGR